MNDDLLVVIEELGVPAGWADRKLLAAAVAVHLERLLAGDPSPPLEGGDTGSIRLTGTTVHDRLADPADLATLVARAVAAALSGRAGTREAW
jgi:hypothetical protein